MESNSSQVVYSRRLSGENWLVTRVFGGIAHAYGNSAEVPYSEQFYVGGANSVNSYSQSCLLLSERITDSEVKSERVLE